jgi:5-(carboxyamino)imidazole ribonucleotide mutase
MQTLVSIIMGSQADWETLQHAELTLGILGIPREVKIISAYKTPDLVKEYAETAAERGLKVIIAGEGFAAHLPALVATYTLLPVLGVPIANEPLQGLDSLLATLQTQQGLPIATLSIGRVGAINAALLAAQILAPHYPNIKDAVLEYRAGQRKKVIDNPDPRRG